MFSLLTFEAEDLEPLIIGDITIAPYGSLTVDEAIAYNKFIRGQALDLVGTATDENEVLAIDHVKTLIATLLLISRHRPDWTLERVGQLPFEARSALSNFFLSEKSRWGKPPKPRYGASEGEPQEIDWRSLRWRLKALYPSESLFDRENFGSCPTLFVEEALDTAIERELERLDFEGRAIANVGVLIASAHGVKQPKTQFFNEFERVRFVRAAKQEIPEDVAKSFVALLDLGRIPEWVAETSNLDVFRAAAS